jgi:hypothetical protein
MAAVRVLTNNRSVYLIQDFTRDTTDMQRIKCFETQQEITIHYFVYTILLLD